MKTKHILLLQRKYGAQGTNGTITYQGEEICHTIELPDRNNIPRISCIPIGQYKLEKRRYAKHGEQIGIPIVLGREAILIHAANNALRELQGCIAPVTTLTGEGRGDYSGKALAKLKALVYSLWDMGDEVYLNIR
ncbi:MULTISPECIES: DUF5675 family protein [Sphingobacterium]|jgi:hypothetical protein|uniref:DUF5675 domain-containing protein n=1 Tax=Sphingobacterium multivorum TaxID=28454 RepID=A0A654DF22_SPHMU|nr:MULTISPECIES: DUF5675 family protein [Sphingobacterium]QQT45480.1 hypothetical protein I6J00_01965 [Sphingobacterium multivorum]SUJ26368.1 Uncharacterised protein [Sphingobacterium multivorum]VXD04543.1 conserved hypothetical protein [Sphingobacterium multivorum]